MKKTSIYKMMIAFVVVLFSFSSVMAQGDLPFNDLPPQPNQFGKCYAKCKVPDRYETVETQVLVKEESIKKITRPAEYTTTTEQILVKEASTKLVPVPAEYETVTEQMLVKEASTRIKEVPPRYETVREKVLVAEGYGKWVRKKRYAGCTSVNPEDCYIMCWEEVPAKYETITKQVLSSPGRTDVVEIPAEYKTVTKRVLRSPARVDEIPIPAEYKTVTKQVLASPATTDEVVIPAEYKTVKERKLVSVGGYTTWSEILCESQQTNSVIRQLQSALNAAGYDAGPADGVMGSKTNAALNKYQQDKGLPVGNMNKETMNALGISY